MFKTRPSRNNMKRILFALLFLAGTFHVKAQTCLPRDTVTANVVSNVTTTTAIINGNVSVILADSADGLSLRYVRVGFTDTVSATSPPSTAYRALTGLQPGTQYRYYYKTSCPSGTSRQYGVYTFTTLVATVVYTPMRSTQVPYFLIDSVLSFSDGDTSIMRAPPGKAAIRYKSSNNTFYGYYPSCTCWRPLAIDSAGIIALLDQKVDSVTVSGDSLFWWNDHGVSHGYILPALANVWKTDASNTGSGKKIGTADAQPFDIYTNATQRIRIKNTGEVGIGTTSPVGLFEVHADSGPVSSIISSGDDEVHFKLNGQGLSDILFSTNGGLTTPAVIEYDGGLFINDVAGTDSLIILNNSGGKVSVGGGASYDSAFTVQKGVNLKRGVKFSALPTSAATTDFLLNVTSTGIVKKVNPSSIVTATPTLQAVTTAGKITNTGINFTPSGSISPNTGIAITSTAGGIMRIEQGTSNQAFFDFTGVATRVYTWPNVTGTLPIGTGTVNSITRWAGTNTIGNSLLLYDNGTSVGVGTASPVASALTEWSSTSQGLLFPRMTQTQRDAISSPAIGLMIYNTTDSAFNYYKSAGWSAIGGGGGGSSLFPTTGTGTATGDVAGDLDGNGLTISNGDITLGLNGTYTGGLVKTNSAAGAIQVGDVGGAVNGNVLLISDNAQLLQFSNSAAGLQLQADYGAHLYGLGDITGGYNISKLTIDDGAATALLRADNGIQFTGNVGIGTAPSVALDVVGDVKLASNGTYTDGLISTDLNNGLTYLGDSKGNLNNQGIIIDDVAQVTTFNSTLSGNSYIFNGGGATLSIANLSGTGTRAVTADASGILSAANTAYNIKAGSFSGVGTATTAFTVTFGGTLPSATYTVNVTPTAALSAALFYISAKTTTTFTVTYLAGLTGTVTFDYTLTQ